MSVLCIIQARIGSTRLPGKSLMDIAGKPLIQHVIDRAAQIRGVDAIVVAVPMADAQAFTAAGITVQGVCGHPADVLGRFYRVRVEQKGHDTFLRLTGDCPLLDPRVAEAVLQLYRDSGAEYAWNDTTTSGYPDGLDAEVFSATALRDAYANAKYRFDREHVTSWMRRNCPTVLLRAPRVYPPDKLSVDTIEDLERIRALVTP